MYQLGTCLRIQRLEDTQAVPGGRSWLDTPWDGAKDSAPLTPDDEARERTGIIIDGGYRDSNNTSLCVKVKRTPQLLTCRLSVTPNAITLPVVMRMR